MANKLTLAIDNSLDLFNLVVAEGERILEERSIKDSRSPSEIITKAVSGILADAGYTIDDVANLFVTLGPGSFTGVRVSLAFCKGISSARQVNLVGVPTLDVLALQLSEKEGHFICPLIDAKKGEVFLALYQASQGKLQRLTGYQAVKPEAVARILQTPCVCFGSGLAICEPFLSGIDGVILERQKYQQVSAKALVKAGMNLMADPPEGKIQPIYGRKSEAEIRFNVTID